MSDKKYQVFVSSTYRGLEEERREVMHALLEMDCIPAGMELFPAANEDVWTLIKSVISECDYYVLIIGGRYGSTDTEGISYTEREYDYAKGAGIPIAAFLHGDPRAIPAGLSEMEPEAQSKLRAFRAKVEDAHHCKYWKSAPELGGIVSRSMNFLVKTKPQKGWVRGDMAKTVDDLERHAAAQERIRELESELEALRRQEDEETAAFAQGNEEMTIPYIHREDGAEKKVAISMSWNDLFLVVGNAVLTSPFEQNVRKAIVHYGGRKIFDDADSHVWFEDADFLTIKRQFLALKLISIDHTAAQFQDRRDDLSFFGVGGAVLWTLWRLTPRGIALLARLTSIPRQAAGGS